MTHDVTHFEKLLLSLAQSGDRETLRRFALDCARAVIDISAAPPLWSEAFDLLEQRVAGSLSEGTFRHRAAVIECRFPLLTILAGLRSADPRAAASLVVMAALRSSALEAALDAARGERLHARLSTMCVSKASAPGGPPGQSAAYLGVDPERAVLYCTCRQAARLGKTP